MRLKNARITRFRCIEDSTTFSVDGVTCLVGKNESGKTSILHALERLNPIEKSSKFEKLRDYPRHLLSDFEEEDNVLTTSWELDDEDVAAVENVLGPDCLTSREVQVEKGYENEKAWVIPVDQAKVIAWLASEAACNKDERSKIAGCTTTQQVVTRAQELKTLESARVTALIERIKKFRGGSAVLAAIDVLSPRMPKFLYFASYDRMEGTVHAETLKHREDNDDLTRSDSVFLSFLEYAGTSLSEILSLKAYEPIKARVEAASIKISKQIFEYWSQNRHLKVEFSAEAGRPGDAPPLNSGLVMRTRIHNKLHDMTVPFDDRSAGFTWFFSFLVLFSHVSKSHGNVIILLDEPGLNLHGKAQADLVRFIYQKLSGKHQVIYTTHSPFMVPNDDLACVRTVEDVVKWKPHGEYEVFGTKVGDEVLSTDRDTLFPLQGALGYEITQSLFIGEHSLVVEGPSDILYLNCASQELKRRGKTGLDSRWTLCPSGGIEKVAAFVSLFGGNKLHVAVLTDFAEGQKNKIDALRRSKLLRDGHVFTTSDFCDQEESDVEDLFGSKLYLDIVNRTYGLKGKSVISEQSLTASGEKSVRVLKQVEAAMRLNTSAPDFDHFAPADWILRNPGVLSEDTEVVNEALERFEKLFQALNPLLPLS